MKKLIIVSLFFNMLFISKIVYNNIKNKKKLTNAHFEVKDKDINKMNSIKMPISIDTSLGHGDTLKVLVVGNSITFHPALKSIDWNLNNGMAANSLMNDYTHILLSKYHIYFPNKTISLKIANLAEWERNFDFNNTDMQKRIINYKLYNSDIAIFQLGENVQENNINNFSINYDSLVEKITNKKTLKILTFPFFPSNRKNIEILKTANITNSLIVDLSSISLLDSLSILNSEKSIYPFNNSWENNGVGLHPGNYGMKRIAELIFQNTYPIIKMYK